MKPSALIISGVLAAATSVDARCARPSETPGCSTDTGKCLGAIRNEAPLVGEDFCSSWLSLPVVAITTTITDATETSTVYNTQTVHATTGVVSTVTTFTTAVSTTYIFQRAIASSEAAPSLSPSTDAEATPSPSPSTDANADPASGIYSACISSACSCYLSLSNIPAASTSTVYATATSLVSVETTTTLTETSTSLTTTTVIESAAASATIPPNPILNGNFGTWKTEGNIEPWTNSSATTGDKLYLLNTQVCVNEGTTASPIWYCNTGSVAQVWPPNVSGGYITLSQVFRAKPNTRYQIDFLYRCFVANSAVARVEMLYQGVSGGSVYCPDQSVGFIRPKNAMAFTTDGTGIGTMTLKFWNGPSGTQAMYHYIAEIVATAV
jgi:hypothetical protein